MPSQHHEVKIEGHTLRLSNLDKPLYPGPGPGGFTKGQLIDYYLRIAPHMLEHLRDRPITFKRFPDGVEGDFFFEKNCNRYRPQWVKTSVVGYGEDNKPIEHCMLRSPADLAWAANVAAIEIHTSLARRQRIDRPTMIAFDLDPGPGVDILECCRVALKLRDLLRELSLECLIKTSGGKGLHLYVPINTPTTYEKTQPFARSLATLLADREPRRITAIMAKAQRKGKVYIDWAQNMLHKTTVCVYSMRARPEPSVSTPVSFEEVERALAKKNRQLLSFGPEDVLARVEKLGDLFEPALTLKQKLPRLEAIE